MNNNHRLFLNKIIKTPAGYGVYNYKNNLWMFNSTHEKIVKNNNINIYNMSYSKYHYLTAYEEDEQYMEKVIDNIFHVFSQDLLPRDHVSFLEFLEDKFKIKPQVIYDIGAAVLHFERHAKRIWPNAKIYCFDAFSPLEELYRNQKVNYQICCLSDVDDLEVKFYQNDMLFGGNSIFKEINDDVFPENQYVIKKTVTLDTLVNNKNIPYPDLIKIDAQSAELNILKGATQCLKCCSYLIVELQEIEYNKGGALKHEVIDYLKSIGYMLFSENFSKNIADSDSCFVNTLRTNYVLNSLN